MLLVLILFMMLLIFLWYKWNNLLRNSSGPILSGCLPIVGHTFQIVGDTRKLWKYIEAISMETLSVGGISRLFIGLQTYYVVTDPEDLATVGNTCIQKHFAFDFAKQWLGDGLITASTSIWKGHRKLLNPAFTVRVVHGFLDIFNTQARDVVENLAKEVNKGPVDLSSHFRTNAMEILSQTALGISVNGGSNLFEKYTKAVDQILELIVIRFQNIWLQSNLIYRLVGLKKKETDLIQVLNDMSNAVIEEKRMTMAGTRKGSFSNSSTGLKYKAFLDLLLDFAQDDTLTDKEIREEVDTLIVAGTDTSSWIMTYICAAIGTYPGVQKRIVEELIEIFQNSDRDVEREDLQKMIYTEAVIKETLRLYPVASLSLRTVETEVQLKNHNLKPGDHVVMSFYGVNRHSVWGPDVNEFRPERWLETDDLPNAFGGFGIGKRACIGKTFAMVSMKVSLAHLLRRYILDSANISELVLKLDFITKPISGHFVALKERKSAH